MPFRFFALPLLLPVLLVSSLTGQSEVLLTGQLQESSSGSPLPYATISLYALPDSSLATNTLTETDGRFALSAAPGQYFARIQYVGYKDLVLHPLEASPGIDTLKLGAVGMQPDAIALDEVEVRAERRR